MIAVSFRVLGRHQAAAALATFVDFGAMTLLVELARIAPPTATLVSAMIGAVANFTLSRGWAYRDAHSGSLSGQATRYTLAVIGGALLNAALLGFFLRIVADRWTGSSSYLVLRAAAAFLVSALYTYPMHIRFVFRVRAREARA